MKIRSMITGAAGVAVMCGVVTLLSWTSTTVSASTAERASTSDVASQPHSVSAFDPSEATAKPRFIIAKKTCPNLFAMCRKSIGSAAQ